VTRMGGAVSERIGGRGKIVATGKKKKERRIGKRSDFGGERTEKPCIVRGCRVKMRALSQRARWYFSNGFRWTVWRLIRGAHGGSVAGEADNANLHGKAGRRISIQVSGLRSKGVRTQRNFNKRTDRKISSLAKAGDEKMLYGNHLQHPGADERPNGAVGTATW